MPCSQLHALTRSGNLFGALLAATLAVLAAGCSSDPYCGDGNVDQAEGEECDDGNDDDTDFCRGCLVYLPPQTTIKWAFNKDLSRGFGGDACIDLGVSEVEVEMVGPTSETMADQCSLRQVVFSELPPGQYVARVNPKNVVGESIVSAPVEATVTVTGNTQEAEVNIPPEAWTRSYTGSFFFRVRWGTMDCGAAVPPVTQQVLTLEQDGSPVAQMTTEGAPLDGTPSACVSANAMSPQTVLEVPFGAATMTIVGLDALGEPRFEQTFDTFVGAGVSNPEFEFDVASNMPDAGVPDAGVADAMPSVDAGDGGM